MKHILIILIITTLVTLLYILLLARLRHRVTAFRNYILFPITAVLGFTVYFIGYYYLNEYDIVTNILLAIFSTIEMIVMKSDINGIALSCRNSDIYMFFFEIAHAMAIVLVITTVLSIWGKLLITKLLLRIHSRKRSYIFFDTNNEALTLAKDLLLNDNSRVVIFVDKDDSTIEEIERMGAHYINPTNSRNKIGGSSLLKNIVSSSSELFYISSDEAHNMNRALTLLKELKKLSPDKLKVAEESIDMHIRIGSEDMQQVFEEARKANGVNLNFSIFNEAEIIATQFIREYPPIKYVNPNTQKGVATTNYDIMVIGFGKRGRAILRKSIEFGQFVGSTYSATVVDIAIKQKMGSFNATYPALSKTYNIQAVEDYASSDTFFELLSKQSSALKQIIISLPNDAQNIKSAIEINKMLSTLERTNIDIIAVTRSTDGYDYMHTSNDFESIHCIGRNQEIYTEAIIVNDALAAQAVAIHNHYNAKAAPTNQQEWRTLSSFIQQSNISVSEHIPTKLALMGLSVEALQQFSINSEYLEFLHSNKELYQNLARTEHLRWNAFYFTRGWRVWELSDKNSAGKPSNDEHRKLHICLVDWDLLNTIDIHQKKNIGTYQGYDYNNSDNIWEIVKIKELF